jgi:hypothetical protein
MQRGTHQTASFCPPLYSLAEALVEVVEWVHLANTSACAVHSEHSLQNAHSNEDDSEALRIAVHRARACPSMFF